MVIGVTIEGFDFGAWAIDLAQVEWRIQKDNIGYVISQTL